MRVLFLCTGNSCRSQMAEGWARHERSEDMEAHSAGVSPIGVNPTAIQAMKEAGVDISRQRSKHVDEFGGQRFDLVITLCDYANAVCPTYPNSGKVVHVPFDDPAVAIGSNEEVMEQFRIVRDQLREFVVGLPETALNRV